jgi:microcystin-dependent protein
MSQPYLGQLQLYGFNFAPLQWQLCRGQLVSINQFAALFSILGTQYGGNGTSNFALPNLQGNVAIGAGPGGALTNYVNGQIGGSPAVTVLVNQLPMHNHNFVASTAPGTTATATGNQLAVGHSGTKGATNYSANIYSPNPASATTGLALPALTTAGGNQPHNNMQPYLALNYCIAMIGTFPSRN